MLEAGLGASVAIGKGEGAEATGMTGAAKGWVSPPRAPMGDAGAGTAKADGPELTATGGGEAGAPPELPNGVKEMVVVAGFSDAEAGAATGAWGDSAADGAQALA